MSATLKGNGQRNDEKIDRVFFLLQNQKCLLQPSRLDPDPDLDHARNEIEKVIAKWLTNDLHARCPFLNSVAAAQGNRDAVAKLLETDLRQVMVARLAKVAQEDVDTDARTESVEHIVEREMQNWKSLLPEIRRRPDGSKYVERGDVHAAQLWRSWGDDLEQWSSYIGASYYLVAACEMLVRRLPRRLSDEQIQHVCRLIQRLREHPDWRAIDAHDVATVVQDQIGRLRLLEEALVELRLTAVGADVGSMILAQPGSASATPLDKAPDPALEFDAVEKAVVLLIRDGQAPRSMRSYAREVDVHHSQLSRSDRWQKVWKAAQAGKVTTPTRRGSKDTEHGLEAWSEEVCENCRQDPATTTMISGGQSVRVCVACSAGA